MKCTLSVAFMLSLLCSAEIAQAQDWKKIPPEDGRMQISAIGGIAETYWTFEEKLFQSTYRCESGSWGFRRYAYRAETTYCWSDGLSSITDESMGGYNKSDSDEFFEFYSYTRDSKYDAGSGPRIETAVGEVYTHAFDVDPNPAGSSPRQCLGFSVTFERGVGPSRKLYTKYLDFYACGEGVFRISEETFLRILSGFSINDEFDSFIP